MSTWKNILFTVGQDLVTFMTKARRKKELSLSHNVSLENVTVEIQDVQNMS